MIFVGKQDNFLRTAHFVFQLPRTAFGDRFAIKVDALLLRQAVRGMVVITTRALNLAMSECRCLDAIVQH